MSDLWRNAYIERFINVDSEQYGKDIAVRRHFSDGVCYTGYLWDCLRSHRRITIQRILARLQDMDQPVLVLWDIHSREKIPIPDYWKFPRDRIIRVGAPILASGLEHLPEDIYIFDEDISWSYILTHEDDGKRRICFVEDGGS